MVERQSAREALLLELARDYLSRAVAFLRREEPPLALTPDLVQTILEALSASSGAPVGAGKWRQGMARAERWVCSVQDANGHIGTGFLVGPRAVLTNCHVIDAAGQEPRVYFDYRAGEDGETSSGRAVGVERIVERSDPAALDYALIELTDDTSERGWCFVSDRDPALPVGAPLSILQHPLGDPLKIAFGKIVSTPLSVPPRITYDTSTLPGSSGAPCFSNQWTLVALHAAGKPGSNTGIPVSAVWRDIPAASKQLLGGPAGARGSESGSAPAAASPVGAVKPATLVVTVKSKGGRGNVVAGGAALATATPANAAVLAELLGSLAGLGARIDVLVEAGSDNIVGGIFAQGRPPHPPTEGGH